tara:strand:+ start:336 stop:632 length:297 start_codon:yes stop_codon:yes gene_type:complete
MIKQFIFLKWSPINKCEFFKSKKKDKKKQISKNITNLALIESNDYNYGLNKKEFNNSKIYDRQLIKQKNLNPFLQSEYLADIENEELYLRPINSKVSI